MVHLKTSYRPQRSPRLKRSSINPPRAFKGFQNIKTPPEAINYNYINTQYRNESEFAKNKLTEHLKQVMTNKTTP